LGAAVRWYVAIIITACPKLTTVAVAKTLESASFENDTCVFHPCRHGNGGSTVVNAIDVRLAVLVVAREAIRFKTNELGKLIFTGQISCADA